MAKSIFAGTSAIRDLKYRYALPKLAALIWLACCHFKLQQADIFLHLLLPSGESKDGDRLGKQLSAALKQGITTPTGRLKLRQRNFYVSNEGSGILSYRCHTLGDAHCHQSIAMLMLGYRNASFTLIERGNQSKAESTDLGMNWLVERFVNHTAVGLSKDDSRLTSALVLAAAGEFDALRSLSRKTKSNEVESDLTNFQASLDLVRREYCRALLRWIRNIAVFDEVLICGGTGEFVHKELTEYFTQEQIPVVWNGGVKIPATLDTKNLGNRLADVWVSHLNHIEMLDANFVYSRSSPLVPQPVAKPESLPEPQPKPETQLKPESEVKKTLLDTRPNHDPWKNFLPMKEGI
ncbi:hypothetical protein FNW02_37545 [Komarekiella sp. 'clone 1']|uniref:Actin-like protein N-terminal domain-containing protein n=1 Tax=Komarekiella delphini-convector SJRDD-AB1 TaxID=2593771 RepID=A0AA40VVV0_9NOST|nr:hypothetical protein [Komarekiella delphini-convector]MBD6621246.1 hypothetical protein [Komarekiella delphini-convector SJRDD-AB1]